MTDVHTEPEKPTNRWTEERRKKHAESIRKWKPWEKSTGPKTREGKARSSQNAWKHGERTIRVSALLAAVRKQKQLHDYARRYARGKTANELLDDPILQWLGHLLAVGCAEMAVLVKGEIMQKPCFYNPFGANNLTPNGCKGCACATRDNA